MHVYYRITDIKSTNPSPIFNDNKYRLNKICLQSFLKAFEGIEYEITFLCDYCSIETIGMIRDLVPESYVIETHIGQNETMIKAYELGVESDDDVILNVECDYLWLPHIGKTYVEAIKTLGIVSPYNHLNFYIDRSIHSRQVMIDLVADHNFRTTERNTMTFGLTHDILKKYIHIFKHYGYLDNEVWKELLEKGHPLWVPIPSFATHMCTDYMAPSINWKELYDKS